MTGTPPPLSLCFLWLTQCREVLHFLNSVDIALQLLYKFVPLSPLSKYISFINTASVVNQYSTQ